MKSNQLTCIFQLLLIGVFVFFFNSCEKTVSPDVLPVLTTTEVTLITEATALSGGLISSDAGNEITSRGVCWSTNPYPTIIDSITKDAAGTGRFTSNVLALIPNTTYYLRAYATNKKGTAYGLQETFTTKSLGITTKEISDTTANSAQSGGVINIDGDSTNIIERGICCYTQPNPTILHFKTVDGKGKGEFDSEMTSLTHNTVYYVRAYITNSSGTYYGNEISFKTLDGVINLTTNDVTSITGISAISGGTIISDGGAPITARGVVWSTVENPAVSLSTKTLDGIGIGSFNSSISGLQLGTTYYVRAYATNSIGTAYGEQVSFNTQETFFPTNGLIAWYPFNGNATDESGNGKNGTVHGATLTSDRFGKTNSAYSFDYDYIKIIDLSSTNSWSVSFWFNVPYTTNFGLSYLFGFGNRAISEFGIPGFGLTGGNQHPPCNSLLPNVMFITDATTGCNAIFGHTPYNRNIWNSVVITKTDNSYSIYHQGSLIYSDITISNITLNELIVGQRLIDNYLLSFKGFIDDIGIWNRELTQEEITNLYNLKKHYE